MNDEINFYNKKKGGKILVKQRKLINLTGMFSLGLEYFLSVRKIFLVHCRVLSRGNEKLGVYFLPASNAVAIETQGQITLA